MPEREKGRGPGPILGYEAVEGRQVLLFLSKDIGKVAMKFCKKSYFRLLRNDLRIYRYFFAKSDFSANSEVSNFAER
jgi:hypothetical protein